MTITCADCGATQMIPPLPPGATVECYRCDRLLGRKPRFGNDLALSAAVATFILLPPAVFMPLMDSTIKNLVFESSRLVSSVPVIYSEVWFPLAFGFLFFAFLFPALRAFMLIVVLLSLKFDWRVWQRGRLFRWSEELRIWSMTDVVAIAGTVAYYRAAVPADVALRVGAWTYLVVAALVIVTDLSLDRREIWNAILPDRVTFPDREMPSCDACELVASSRRRYDPCPRCGVILDHDVAPRVAPALGAIGAAIPLLLPAYAASIMINNQLTSVLEHTIIGTVQLLADHGAWQFGAIVLIAGIVIPVVEMIGMLWLLSRVRFPRREGLILRTRVYRVLYQLVRWPMIIPFIAAIAAPIVDFRGIDDIAAGPGATPLFMLIVLLMLAVRLFEPRLMWKTAGATG
jgi:paraquat-inducible protein A